jgi:hypothetical protein
MDRSKECLFCRKRYMIQGVADHAFMMFARAAAAYSAGYIVVRRSALPAAAARPTRATRSPQSALTAAEKVRGIQRNGKIEDRKKEEEDRCRYSLCRPIH